MIMVQYVYDDNNEQWLLSNNGLSEVARSAVKLPFRNGFISGQTGPLTVPRGLDHSLMI